MIDVDPRFRAAHQRRSGPKAALGRGVERDRDVKILRFAQGCLEEFATWKKTVLLQESVLVSHHYCFAEFRQRKGESKLAPQSVAIRADVAENCESLLGTQNCANLVEARL